MTEALVKPEGGGTLALVKAPKPPNLSGLSLHEAAKVAAKSGFFKGLKVEGALAKIQRGQELGIGPIAALEGIFLQKERLVMSANLMAAVLQNSGRFKFKVKELTNKGCKIDFYEREEGQTSWELVGTSTFDEEDRKTAGLSNDTYKKFPRNMFYSRAMSNGCKWFAPGAFSAPVYLPDELPDSGLRVNPETLEVVTNEAPDNGEDYIPSADFIDLFNQLPEERQKALLAHFEVDSIRKLDEDMQQSAISKMKLFLSVG
jgi:hypothetical protein